MCINGGGRPVTPQNVFEYVQQHILLRMVNLSEPMLTESIPCIDDMYENGMLLSIAIWRMHMYPTGSMQHLCMLLLASLKVSKNNVSCEV